MFQSSLNCEAITRSKATGSCFKKNAFTLIEVLVVIAIIGLLASIVLVSTKEVRERARIAKGLNFAAQVHHALGAYAVGIWDFNEGSDGTCSSGKDVCDSSGNGNDGTINGATWTAEGDTPSGKGYALSFDGVDDYVNCGNKTSLNITDEITIEVWTKSKAFTSKTLTVVSKPGSCYLYTRASWYDRAYFFLYFDGGTEKSLSGNQVPTDIWQRIVVTYKESDRTMRMFQDTVETKTRLLTGLTNYHIDVTTNALTISRIGAPFNGLIDDVRIYEQALSSAQVKKLYVEGLEKHKIAEK